MKYAHYFKAGKKHELIISTGYSPTGETLQVSGKKEAKQLAKKLNAQPWNF